LLTRTIEAVRLMAAGQPVTAGLLRAEASTLTDAVLHAMAATKRMAAGVLLLLACLAMSGAAAAYHMLPHQPSNPEQPPKEPQVRITEQDPNPDPDPNLDPDPKKYGTAAGARNFAKGYFRNNVLSARWGPPRRWNEDDGGPLPWPSRAFEVTFDGETHQWTVTGSGRVDTEWLGSPGKSWEWEWKLVLSYNPSARGYEVQKAEWPDISKPGTVRPARMDDYRKWLQGRFTKPGRSADSVTALQLVLEVPERTRLGLEPKYSYGKDKLAVEPRSRGVSVRIGDPGAGEKAVRWGFLFDASLRHSLKVGEYGGAGHSDVGPQIIGGGNLFRNEGEIVVREIGFRNEGEFVVWEIELQDNKITRLAIDFIMDSEYGLPATDKRDSRNILRGSLRYNSQFKLSIPELDRDAAE
jgi:hypothetical protein